MADPLALGCSDFWDFPHDADHFETDSMATLSSLFRLATELLRSRCVVCLVRMVKVQQIDLFTWIALIAARNVAAACTVTVQPSGRSSPADD
jgi:hypothetical protein